MFGTRYVGAIHGMLITAWSVAGVLGPNLVSQLRQYQIDHGIAKAQAYNITMYIMAGLLAVGLICNFLVRPVNPRFHMKADAGRGAAVAAAPLGTVSATSTSPVLVLLAWALVGVPLLWGVYETLLNAMKLFK
jgi:hypothetical protein